MHQSRRATFWRLVDRQHGLVTRNQLTELGLSPSAIKHRIAVGRLHVVRRGVYSVSRRLTQDGRWMAAVLSCGPEAFLSHGDAAALQGFRPAPPGPIEVTVRAGSHRHRPGIVIHRRTEIRPDDVTKRHGIPVTSPACTIVDIATRLDPRALEAAVNEADKLGLIDPEALRAAAARMGRRPGARAVRQLLDRQAFTLTDSELERRFLPLARAAGLPAPATQRALNGFRVDFYWPDLGLVVETDGLRYHRTPGQQRRDRRRDQTHAAAGLTPLRFTHDQVAYEPDDVRATLAAVARRLRSRAWKPPPPAG